MRKPEYERVRGLGIVMLVYAFFFSPQPLCAIWKATLVLYHDFGKIPNSLVVAKLTITFSDVFLISWLWLPYLLSGIGILRLKRWAKILGICTVTLAALWTIGGWLRDLYLCTTNHPACRSDELVAWGAILGIFTTAFIGLPNIGLLIGLTRPGVKECFNQR